MWTRSRRLAAIAIVLVSGCGGSECKVENVEYAKSLTAAGNAGELLDVGVTLAPNQTLTVGQVFTSTQPLGQGGARVLIQVARYVP
jgi:hypothetical protein